MVIAARRPVPVGGGAARRAARTELAKPEYRHGGKSLPERVVDWIGRRLGELFDHAGGGDHALLLIVVVLLAVGLVFAVRAGVPQRSSRGERAMGTDPLAPVDAREHRRLAARFEADGEHAQALREWLRAAIATVEQRGVLPARPGRTGRQTAAEAGPMLPSAAEALATATAAFDDVWFGGRAATPGDSAVAHRAADLVRDARIRADATVPSGIAAPW